MNTFNEPTINRHESIVISGYEFPSIAEAEKATPRMDPERKPLILAVLRMPGLAQTTGVLSRLSSLDADERVGQCCLGVMCEVAYAAAIDGLGMERHARHTVTWKWSEEGVGDLSQHQVLPGPVADWLGWSRYNNNPDAIPAGMAGHSYVVDGTRRIEPNTSPLALAEINDAGFTFSQIADIIDYFL